MNYRSIMSYLPHILIGVLMIIVAYLALSVMGIQTFREGLESKKPTIDEELEKGIINLNEELNKGDNIQDLKKKLNLIIESYENNALFAFQLQFIAKSAMGVEENFRKNIEGLEKMQKVIDFAKQRLDYLNSKSVSSSRTNQIF